MERYRVDGKSDGCTTGTKIASACAGLFFVVATLTTVALIVVVVEYDRDNDSSQEVMCPDQVSTTMPTTESTRAPTAAPVRGV